MTDKQPTALFLAEQMEDGRWRGMNDLLAAAELRRLHEENEALRTALAQTDEQIGITYEEANPPQPYCTRCGKKLGTEVTDIHTCTPIRKKWVGLTDEELSDAYNLNYNKYFKNMDYVDFLLVYKAVEAKLKDKNNG